MLPSDPISWEDLISLISVISSPIFAIVMFVLSSNRSDKVSMKDVLRKRLDSFYVPFYQRYSAGFLSKNLISDLSIESFTHLLDLLTQNIHYMGTKSQSYYPEVYQAFLQYAFHEEEISPQELKKLKDRFDDSFKAIAKAIFEEYRDICRKLKLPKPAI